MLGEPQPVAPKTAQAATTTKEMAARAYHGASGSEANMGPYAAKANGWEELRHPGARDGACCVFDPPSGHRL